MALHVDVVKNDWLAGIQYPLATLRMGEDGEVEAVADHPERWQNIVDELNASDEPAEALAQLHTTLNGSHLFATGAHGDEDCPYRSGPVYLRGRDVSRDSGRVPA
jgi:hypothetical protein